MRLGRVIFALTCALAGLVVSACGSDKGPTQGQLPTGGGGDGGSGGGTIPPGPSVCTPGGELPDLDQLAAKYDADDGVQPLTMRIDTSDLAGLANVQADAADAQVDVHISEGDFGAGDTAPNASMRLRGLTVRMANQKSYRIKMSGGGSLWRGQHIFHLNKHPWDLARVRQKLSFDLFKTVPGFASLQTRFVHVLINGEDQGLYTAIENPDEYFLLAHGLPQGTVYMPVYFDFYPIPDEDWADLSKLDTIIEAKTADDLPKLRKMIDAVNDLNTPIDEVVRQFFNRKNYETWLALNVMVGNWDQGATNYLIYSPSGCDGWYFLPWDYDGSWDWYGQPGADKTLLTRWRAGLTVYWGSALHSRFLREPANVAEVEAIMQTLGGDKITDAQVSALLDHYRDTVSAAVSVAPDVWYLPTPTMVTAPEAYAAWQTEYDRIRGVATQYKKEYAAARTRPAPIWLNQVDRGTDMYFEWGASYSFQGDPLVYDFELATSTSFRTSSMKAQMLGLTISPGQAVGSVTIPKPTSGHYNWRVLVRDQNNPQTDWQVPFVVYQPIDIAAQ
jgi:spore coat protein H